MFTGIISYVFKIRIKDNTVTLYSNERFCKQVKIGDSVAINGICLTIIQIDFQNFTCFFNITEETISKTNIKNNIERLANIELAVKYGDHLGGHLILGHVHTTGKVLSIEDNGNLWISTSEFAKLIYKGSVAINGISLTIAEISDNRFRIALIPETIRRTAPLLIGDIVNIEFDNTFPNLLNNKDPMIIAIEEGEKGRTSCFPNPWVGCVIVKDGNEISRGYHQKTGCNHAEVNAINNAKNNLEGSIMYVTLEPCCNFPGKRTPPCVEAIIREKISKVIIGVKDPNPSVSGKGADILRQAGIEVEFQENINLEIYQKVCFSLRQYIYRVQNNSPYITLKIALSIDSCYKKYDGTDKWITHAGSREKLYKIWDESQIIIIGAETVQKDDPELNTNDSKKLGEVEKNNDFNFKKVVIDGASLTAIDHKLFSNDDPNKNAIVVTNNIKKWKTKNLNLIEVTDTYNLKEVMKKINETFENLTSCLVEGGGKLHKSFCLENLVNEIVIFRGAKFFGEDGIVWDMPLKNIYLKDIEMISYHGENNIMERYIVKQTGNKPIDDQRYKFDDIDYAIKEFSRGAMVLVMDDESRENEGDLIAAANKMSETQMTEMINMTTGIICVPMEKSHAKKLNLSPMIENNTDPHGTAFTISVDSKETGTGVSSKDRLLTVKALANQETISKDLRFPGHIFPLVARGSLKERRGHTEAAVTLCKLANIYPRVAVIGELKNKNGTMKRRDDCFKYAKANNIPIITVDELSKFDFSPKLLSECELDTKYGETPWRFLCYDSGDKMAPHKVLIYGNLDKTNITSVRIHSECFTGDVLKSLHCDCGEQLDISLNYIVNKNSGIVIFPSSHEGRGIGIVEKIKAYSLQKEGYNTFEANQILGHQLDARTYYEIDNILNHLGISKIELLTENPEKISKLGNKVIQNIPVKSIEHSKNSKYLQDKRNFFSNNNELEIDKITPVPEIKSVNKNSRIAIVYSSWHEKYISQIRNKLKNYLIDYGITNIEEHSAPGSNEIPFIASKVSKNVDGIICVGILIKGDTLHFENVSNAVSTGIMQAQLISGIPMMNVILSCFNFTQVDERINGSKSTLKYVVEGLLSIL